MDSNDKILLSGSDLTLGLVRNTPNLRGIRDNLPAFDTWQIYSLSPRPEIFVWGRFCGFQRKTNENGSFFI